MTLKHLRELDPKLADWWIYRRLAAWSEVGLVRPPEDIDTFIADRLDIQKASQRALDWLARFEAMEKTVKEALK